MEVILIAAAGINNQIGYQGKLPWRIKEELSFFKQITTNNTILMGKNTWLSIGKPLPDRVTIVLSKTLTREELPDGVHLAKSKIEALEIARAYRENKLFICGGEQVYKAFLDDYTSLIISRVNYDGPADAWLPKLDLSDYKPPQVLTSYVATAKTPEWFAESYQRKNTPSHCPTCGLIRCMMARDFFGTSYCPKGHIWHTDLDTGETIIGEPKRESFPKQREPEYYVVENRETDTYRVVDSLDEMMSNEIEITDSHDNGTPFASEAEAVHHAIALIQKRIDSSMKNIQELISSLRK